VEQKRLEGKTQELFSFFGSSQTVDNATFDPQDLVNIAKELRDVTINDDLLLFPNDLCSSAITLDMLIS